MELRCSHRYVYESISPLITYCHRKIINKIQPFSVLTRRGAGRGPPTIVKERNFSKHFARHANPAWYVNVAFVDLEVAQLVVHGYVWRTFMSYVYLIRLINFI